MTERHNISVNVNVMTLGRLAQLEEKRCLVCLLPLEVGDWVHTKRTAKTRKRHLKCAEKVGLYP